MHGSETSLGFMLLTNQKLKFRPYPYISIWTNKRSYQKRCEDCKECPKTQNNRVPNSLIEDSFALKEAALSYTSSSSCHIVLLWEFERGACWRRRRRRCHTEKKKSKILRKSDERKLNSQKSSISISILLLLRMSVDKRRYLCIKINVRVWKSN